MATKSKINTLNSLVIAPSAASLNVADSVRQSLTTTDIDWYQTFLIREKREPVLNELVELIKKEAQFFIPITLTTNETTLFPTYNFVFDGIFRGKSSFNKIIEHIQCWTIEMIIYEIYRAFTTKRTSTECLPGHMMLVWRSMRGVVIY